MARYRRMLTIALTAVFCCGFALSDGTWQSTTSSGRRLRYLQDLPEIVTPDSELNLRLPGDDSSLDDATWQQQQQQMQQVQQQMQQQQMQQQQMQQQQQQMQQQEGTETPVWLDPTVSTAARVADLVSRLTLQEKLGLMHNVQAPVERLGIPGYQFWAECLHGHQEQGSGALPTIFPQPVVLASSFDEALAGEVFTAISDELRAKSNAEYASKGKHSGLICWTPHINIFRDPRWGRGSETFGEDPTLTSRLGSAVVKGLRGNHAVYSKVIATCKHWLGYSLEGALGVSRYAHDIHISPQDLVDTDLPPFEACIQGAGGRGIMCAYNAVNGTPSCASEPLLRDLLRGRLGFDGYVVSDCNAIMALRWGHRFAESLRDASAAAVRAGVDLFCDRTDGLPAALEAGLLSEAELDVAVARSMTMRFLTGQFDPPQLNPWGELNTDLTVNGPASRALARRVVHEGAVLLKNEAPPGRDAPMLPLDAARLNKLCVTGPLSDSPEHQMGNYYGRFDSKATSTPLSGLQSALAESGVTVSYAYGMDLIGQIHYDWPLEDALEACKGADAAVVVVGGSMIENHKDASTGAYRPATEGEGLDRTILELPGRQADLIHALARRAPDLPQVIVLMHGGGVDIEWALKLPQVAAVLAVGFPGQEGGNGLADILLGRVSPSGRLPITWYRANASAVLSPLELGMRPNISSGHPGRSYRFLTDESLVLFPFGHGLSYTSFSYSNAALAPAGQAGCSPASLPGPAYCVRVTVTNTGSMNGAHVVPLYLSNDAVAGTGGRPLRALRGFARTRVLAPGESQALEIRLAAADFSLARPSDGELELLPGPWTLALGTWNAAASQSGTSSNAMTAGDAAAAAAAANAADSDSRQGLALSLRLDVDQAPQQAAAGAV